MKIEKLKPQFCQQALGSFEVCGEIAYYRITTDTNTCSVAFCQDHAVKFLQGKQQLKEVKCTYCKNVLQPGYYLDERYRAFCNEEHRGAWDGSQTLSIQYR